MLIIFFSFLSSVFRISFLNRIIWDTLCCWVSFKDLQKYYEQGLWIQVNTTTSTFRLLSLPTLYHLVSGFAWNFCNAARKTTKAPTSLGNQYNKGSRKNISCFQFRSVYGYWKEMEAIFHCSISIKKEGSLL